MTNSDDEVHGSVGTAELEQLIADRIGPPLSALCDRLSLGDSAWRQRVNFRDSLTHSVAEAIRSAVRPLEDRIEALEGDLRREETQGETHGEEGRQVQVSTGSTR